MILFTLLSTRIIKFIISLRLFQFTEIIFEDHQTGKKIYFKSRNNQAIKASLNYGKSADTYGLWDGVGADPAYSYQLLICDDPFYRGFLISAHTGGCFMTCTDWCSDVSASFFRTAFTNSHGQKGGVAFGEKGHDVHDKRRISIGLGLVFSFPGPVVNTKADLICIYFKCFLGVQFVNSCTLVLVISSYFFSLSLQSARHS